MMRDAHVLHLPSAPCLRQLELSGVSQPSAIKPPRAAIIGVSGCYSGHENHAVLMYLAWPPYELLKRQRPPIAPYLLARRALGGLYAVLVATYGGAGWRWKPGYPLMLAADDYRTAAGWRRR